jgi:hypothetical protein
LVDQIDQTRFDHRLTRYPIEHASNQLCRVIKLQEVRGNSS